MSVIVVALLVVPTAAVSAKPTPGYRTKEFLHWPDNTVINIYVPADPDGLGRDGPIGDGLKAWNSDPSLMKHGVSVNVHMGASPGGKNDVAVNYWTGPEQRAGHTTPKLAAGGPIINGGKIDIRLNETDKNGHIIKDANNKKIPRAPDKLKNAAEHEMGHLFGLDHSKDPNDIMYSSEQDSWTGNISAEDHKELAAVYGFSETKINFRPTVIPDGSRYRYDYKASWLSGPSLAYVAVDIHGASLTSIVPPDGWRIVDGTYPDDVSVKGPSGRESFIAFVIDDESAYLGLDNPDVEFSFISDRAPGTVGAFFNGSFTTVGPGTVPEPATWGLLVTGFGATGAMLRRRRSPAAATP